jgi:hypothetical protein
MKYRSCKDVDRRMETANEIRRRPTEGNVGETGGGVISMWA